MNKKSPILRTCIQTRKLLPKGEMFRVVRNSSGVYFDKNQNMMGRGVYISKDLNVINLAQKKHSLSKGLKCDVKDDIYLELIQELSRDKERR